jgi:rhodanese-related sulfurtransferase
MKTALFALLFSISSIAFADDKFADISQADLAAAIKAKTVVVIDVNGSDSFKAGHIPTAVDFDAKGKEIASVLPADKAALVVAYCGNENCSAWKSAATAVAALGYTNVKHFTPGLAGWKKSGADLQK